jgi:hypothetical protein
MKSFLQKRLSAAVPARRTSVADGEQPSAAPTGSSVGALADMVKANVKEKGAATKRQGQLERDIRRALDEACANALQFESSTDDKPTGVRHAYKPGQTADACHEAFQALERRVLERVAAAFAEEDEAQREKVKQQSSLFETRLATMRRASTVQLKQQQIEANHKTEKALVAQRVKLLEGGDGKRAHALSLSVTTPATRVYLRRAGLLTAYALCDTHPQRAADTYTRTPDA